MLIVRAPDRAFATDGNLKLDMRNVCTGRISTRKKVFDGPSFARIRVRETVNLSY
jgi:hypothetical protein